MRAAAELFKVSIIGGGPTGTAHAVQILRNFQRAEVTLYSPIEKQSWIYGGKTGIKVQNGDFYPARYLTNNEKLILKNDSFDNKADNADFTIVATRASDINAELARAIINKTKDGSPILVISNMITPQLVEKIAPDYSAENLQDIEDFAELLEGRVTYGAYNRPNVISNNQLKFVGEFDPNGAVSLDSSNLAAIDFYQEMGVTAQTGEIEKLIANKTGENACMILQVLIGNPETGSSFGDIIKFDNGKLSHQIIGETYDLLHNSKRLDLGNREEWIQARKNVMLKKSAAYGTNVTWLNENPSRTEFPHTLGVLHELAEISHNPTERFPLLMKLAPFIAATEEEVISGRSDMKTIRKKFDLRAFLEQDVEASIRSFVNDPQATETGYIRE